MTGKEEPGFVCKTVEPIIRKSDIVNSRFTRSMESIYVPKTMEHNDEPIFFGLQ